MTNHYELPEVGEPRWDGTERDRMAVADAAGEADWKFTLCAIDEDIEYYSERLAALLVAQEFVTSESEKSRLDCAGERAFIAERVFHENTPIDYRSWDELRKSERDYWMAVAKAVLDGEK
jgi:hypothetical protein